MHTRIFQTKNGSMLRIKNKKSAIIFEIEKKQRNREYIFIFTFTFTPEDFAALFSYLEQIATGTLGNIRPKKAFSLGADYDRELDNNGYLWITKNKVSIKRPSIDNVRLYQFNKRKMESFLFDF
ncbi:hypothetical protein OCF65_28645 [Bacillus toyonensis]|uniref:hypothetical protein n=1 Tax=Bacillus toyonensis TaxID=155322 RepID=UPI0006AA54BA|nr:hypothetical protein [Bacillus toyonensis]MCU5584335.1 hypothetical protein [Bacillus toyonensis]OKO50537.1 hypothetical protein ABH17_029185 [Bacillus toyonensis]